VQRLILTGQVTEQCVLYTALDAYVRHFSVIVPPDAVARIDPELGDAALTMMHKNMRAAIVPRGKVPERTPVCGRVLACSSPA
jgi:nicotinamidase-related amidase